MDQGDLAGASQPGLPPDERNPDQAREVFPVVMDKDFRTNAPQDHDFRPIAERDEEEVPKASSALAFATTLHSTTGLEDVFAEDLEDPANPDALKVTSQATTPASGSQTS